MYMSYFFLGVHTVEGNVAGARAARLTKERDLQKAEYENIKMKIKQQNAADLSKIDNKFNSGRYYCTCSLHYLTNSFIHLQYIQIHSFICNMY